MKFKRLIIFGLAFVCLHVGTARAQLFLEEGKVVLSVSPGERINKKLNVHNTSKEEVNVRIYWEDFQYKEPYDGGKDFIPPGSSLDTANKWVSYTPQVFKLPAYGKQEIDYSVNVPSDMKGGHYGVLFFETTGDPNQSQTGLSLITRVGSLFFFEPVNKIKKALISDVQVVDNKLKGSFENQGDIILTPHMTYNIIDKEGLVDDRGEIKALYVPPGKFGKWEIVLPKSIKSGEHTVLINADLLDGDVTVKEIQIQRDETGTYKIINVRD